MADDAKGGTPEVIANGGEKPGGIQTEQETPEQKVERLEKLNKDKDAELLAWKPKIEEANRIIEASRRAPAQPPTRPAEAAPTFSREQYDRLVALRDDPNEDERARVLAAGQIAAIYAASLTYNRTLGVERGAQLAELPEADRAKAMELLDSGKAADIDDAKRQIRLEKLSPLELENKALKERLAQAEASGNAPRAPGTAARGVGGGSSQRESKTITDSERERIFNEGTPKEQYELLKAIRSGEIKPVLD